MVAEEDVQAAEGLISFIEQCPSMFHTAATIIARLEAQGFARLSEGNSWRAVCSCARQPQRASAWTAASSRPTATSRSYQASPYISTAA